MRLDNRHQLNDALPHAKQRTTYRAVWFTRNQLPPCNLARHVQPAMVRRFAAACEVAPGPLESELSFPYINAAWETKCPTPAAKLVLVALADHANAKGSCWPSIPRMAKRCGISTRSVMRQIKQLETAGLIAVKRERGESNRYILLTKTTPDKVSRGSDKPATPVTPCRPTPDTVSPKPSVNPHSEPKGSQRGSHRLFPNEIKDIRKTIEQEIARHVWTIQDYGSKPEAKARAKEEIKQLRERETQLKNQLINSR